jgi:sigma-B regulation protein RsbU (phosphoserine phosphatase)
MPSDPGLTPRPERRASRSVFGLPPSTAAPIPPMRPPRELVLRRVFGRLFLIAAAVKLVALLIQATTPLPTLLRVVSSAATLGLLVSAAYFAVKLVGRMKRRLLWRVRRKLILSYVFIGFVPALLIIAFFLFGGLVMFMNVSAYFFKDAYDELIADTRVMAQTLVLEIQGTGMKEAGNVLKRHHARYAGRYSSLSLAVVPTATVGAKPGASVKPAAPAAVGPWAHLAPPSIVRDADAVATGTPEPPAVLEERLQGRRLPAWVREHGFAGTLAYTDRAAPGRIGLVLRAVALPEANPQFAVIVDLPFDEQVAQRLRDETGVRAGDITLMAGEDEEPARPLMGRTLLAAGPVPADEGGSGLFRNSVAFLDFTDWNTRRTARASISISVPVNELYQRLSAVQTSLPGGMHLGEVLLLGLLAVGVLFFIIELVALVMGLALARSITSSVHELFVGTERVRQGDFTHRIDIPTKDQLGELADSFNQMTGSIENLLQTAAEKKRLEEELRIAREIQMSLLPRGPLGIAGLAVTALCVPAREVGGDYYDVFPLGEARLGVLIADVAGKGTSAALYMAELKGIVLSLSQIHQSPRLLLIEVNRILSTSLDTRSFITMTYAVIDLNARTMTYARAGHTPMVYLPGPAATSREARVLSPGGMVVGLRIDGVAERFPELLEEETLPILPGDVFVLYTDGITEAMNADSDLFGESRLSRIVEEHGHLESSELRERIVREVEAFVGGADQHDDMTMILLKVEEAPAQAVRPALASLAARPH